MKIVRWLGLPWMALSRRWRLGSGIGFALLLAVIVVACALKWRGAASVPGTARAMATFDCLFWAFALSQSLLLAREAHRLRLPALGREVAASLMLYTLLTMALPALLLGWLGGDAAVVLTECALGAGLGMAYATLPAYVGTFACFVPMLGDHAGPWLPMPATSPDGFLAWAAPCTLALWLLIAGFWRSNVRRDIGLGGKRQPIILNLRMQAWHGRARSNHMEVELIRRRVKWLQPVVDLRHSGPGHAVRNLRIAMGGWGMPLTTISRLQQFAVVLASMALPMLVMSVVWHGVDFPRSFLDSSKLLVFVLSVFGAVLALAQVQTLQRRWNRPNAELPLLALLPGLGDAAQVKRALLQANLLPTLGLQALLTLAMLGFAAAVHMAAGACVMLLFGPLTGATMLASFALITVGGVRIGEGWQFALAIYGYLLINVSVLLALPLFDSQPAIRHPAVALIAAVAWATLFAILLCLAQRGWRGLQQRPHPFLPNA
ncbi:MAG: hypothetical protein RSP_07200 [Rhodanobacter sp.]